MERTEKKQIKFGAVVVVVFEIVFAIFVVLTVRNSMKDDIEVANVRIENFSAIPELSVVDGDNSGAVFDLDETKKSVIGGVLYDEILLNNVGSINNSDARIREGSAYNVYLSDLDVYVLNFIVDIDSLQQSYRVVYRWTNRYPNDNIPQNVPALAFCVNEDELLYEDFECRDGYNGYGEDVVVYNLLQNKAFNNFTISLYGDVYNGEPLTITINTDSDENSVKNAAVGEVSSYLSSIGFDLNDFDYTVGARFVY